MEFFGVSRYIAVPLALAGIWIVTVLGNYSRAERVFLVMGLVFMAYPMRRSWATPAPARCSTISCGRTSCTRRRSCCWRSR